MFVVKGDQVSFLLEDGEEFFLPERHVVIHDPLNRLLRNCDFFFVGYSSFKEGMSFSDTELQAIVLHYYGPLPMSEIDVEVPLKGWKPQKRRVKAIRYRRVGDLAALYHHKYNEPQPLFEHGRKGNPTAWRLSPPVCIADRSGFVFP